MGDNKRRLPNIPGLLMKATKIVRIHLNPAEHRWL